MSGAGWLMSAPPKTAAVRLRVDPADYPDGIIPARTGLRKIGTADDGAEIYEPVPVDAPDTERPFLLTDVEVEKP
jgi:hypothetical protein